MTSAFNSESTPNASAWFGFGRLAGTTLWLTLCSASTEDGCWELVLEADPCYVDRTVARRGEQPRARAGPVRRGRTVAREGKR